MPSSDAQNSTNRSIIADSVLETSRQSHEQARARDVTDGGHRPPRTADKPNPSMRRSRATPAAPPSSGEHC